jgi:hypothetical protein
MFTSNSVTVITATTGGANLGRCIRSVQGQSFGQVEHLVVTDGPEHAAKVQEAVSAAGAGNKALNRMELPFATGRDRWGGHRIYAAASFLCNTEYVCFLDEDNWLEADHVESLIAAVAAADVRWGFALRKIVDREGKFVALDECVSLGTLHPIFQDERMHYLDSNCFLMHRGLAVHCSPKWYVPGRREPERGILRQLRQGNFKSASNRRHTVNRTLSGGSDEAPGEYFVRGNEEMHKRYPNGMPWLGAAQGKAE